MDGMLATAREHPADDEDAQKDESGKKVITMFLNQGIQEPGRTLNLSHRVFHTFSSEFFWFIA